MPSEQKSQAPCSPLYHTNTKADAERAHDALVADPILWSRLSFSGVQPDFGVVGVFWEMRDCPCCGSTLNRRISKDDALGTIADLAGCFQRSLDALRG